MDNGEKEEIRLPFAVVVMVRRRDARAKFLNYGPFALNISSYAKSFPVETTRIGLESPS